MRCTDDASRVVQAQSVSAAQVLLRIRDADFAAHNIRASGACPRHPSCVYPCAGAYYCMLHHPGFRDLDERLTGGFKFRVSPYAVAVSASAAGSNDRRLMP